MPVLPSAPVRRPARVRRGTRLATWSWIAAGLVIVGLAVAVITYLGGHRTGPSSQGGGAAGALTRAGGHPFGPLLGSALLTAWQLNAVALAVIVLLAAWYLANLALRSARGTDTAWPVGCTLSYFAGLAVIGYATNGAVGVYDQALFSAHMLGHLALVMVAPALLLAGRPLRLAVESGPDGHRERLERVLRGPVIAFLTAPPVALACYTVVVVGSHLTGIINSIMRVTWAGEVEHLVYLVVGVQFFILVIGNEPIRWRLSSPVRWLLLAVAMAVDTFTGIVLMQGTSAVAMRPTPGLHVDVLSDTHTGGAVMWFGGDALMAAVMVALVIGWLRRVETAEADEKGWLEQARRATFSEHTGDASTDAGTFDEADRARTSYNEWLQRLDDR